MGWRDRDWAKFTDDERAALFGGGMRRPLPPSAEGAAHRRSQPIAGHRRIGSRHRKPSAEVVLITLALFSALAFGYDHFHHSKSVRSITLRPVIPLVAAPPRTTTTFVVVQPPSDVVAIRWRASDLAPAPQAGRVCVTDARHGRICASYVVGERPADTLTREIESLGLRVESAGGG